MSFSAELDELMGKNRNAPKHAVIKKEHFSDPEVCKYYLVSICPHELFPNTKYDLGRCPKRHDELFKKQFKELDENEKVHYEKRFIDETLNVFSKHVSIIDTKIKKTQIKPEGPTPQSDTIPAEYREKIDNVDTEIKKLLRYVEHLGEIGKIDESEKLTEEIERLKRTKEDLRILADNPTLAAKQMKVCEICGAMQAINDTEIRNQNHLEGKVHTGFALLRKELKNLRKRKEILKLYSAAEIQDGGWKWKEKEEEGEKEGKEREEDSWERRRKKKKKKEKKRREREREREKSRKRKKKDKERDRDRRRYRSRSREKLRRRERSRDERERERVNFEV